MVSNFYNGIVNCKLWINAFHRAFLDFFKLQPLERLIMYVSKNLNKKNFKKIIYALEFRSETLKELSFESLDFRGIDLSFMSKLKSLERLGVVVLYHNLYLGRNFFFCCEYDDHSERINILETGYGF